MNIHIMRHDFDNSVIVVDLEYPNLGYKLTNVEFSDWGIDFDVTVVEASGGENINVPDDLEAHYEEVMKEFQRVIENTLKESYNK